MLFECEWVLLISIFNKHIDFILLFMNNSIHQCPSFHRKLLFAFHRFYSVGSFRLSVCLSFFLSFFFFFNWQTFSDVLMSKKSGLTIYTPNYPFQFVVIFINRCIWMISSLSWDEQEKNVLFFNYFVSKFCYK